MDYIEKLSPEEKRWLSDFNNTYYGNTYPRKSKSGPKTNMFDKAGITRKEIFDQTNARNRDIFNKRYKFNENEQGIAIPETYSQFTSPEDALIEYLDTEEKMKDFVKSALEAQTSREFTEALTRVVFNVE